MAGAATLPPAPERRRGSALRSSLRLCACLCALGGCVLFGPPDHSETIAAAITDLRDAGFEFEPDVHIAYDALASCAGVDCTSLRLRDDRRTIGVARDALDSPSRLRAALLHAWARYREPRPGSLRDLAQGALRVLRDGPSVGVRDPAVLRSAHHAYRRLYRRLKPAEREGLPRPADLPFP